MTTAAAAHRPLEAYEALALAYDALTADYRHDRWLMAIDALLRDLGARGGRLLDLGCGTGKSFLPMLERGYAVTACDLSPGMASLAARKAPTARVFVADMCTLGRCGAFDVVSCLDDALNYLLDERANLASGGLAVWDVNALTMYRSSFASDWIAERDGYFIAWSGGADPDVGSDAVVEATIDVFAPDIGPGAWSRTRSVHRQRHWPVPRVVRIASESGLCVVAMRGQRRGAVLDRHVDETVHTKVLFVACRDDDRRASEGGAR